MSTESHPHGSCLGGVKDGGDDRLAALTTTASTWRTCCGVHQLTVGEAPHRRSPCTFMWGPGGFQEPTVVPQPEWCRIRQHTTLWIRIDPHFSHSERGPADHLVHVRTFAESVRVMTLESNGGIRSCAPHPTQPTAPKRPNPWKRYDQRQGCRVSGLTSVCHPWLHDARVLG